MSKKTRLKEISEEIKTWAIDNTAPSGLHTLIQKLNEEIETMDGTGTPQNDDPGGNHPPSKPKFP